MEVRCRGMDGERERRRHSSSSSKAVEVAAAAARPTKKVQVFYYLSRNGVLEQPHFVEVCVFPNQPLRLKDVLNRLTVLRGKAMPSLYSWSCKRNYKSGYVWNDLSENDVVYPAEGSEYVLKGSELFDARSGTVKLQEIEMRKSKQQQQQPDGINSRKQKLGPSPLREMDDPQVWDLEYEEGEEEEEEYEEEEEGGEKGSRSESTRGVSTESTRCSHGVSTERKGNGEEELIKYMSENPRFGKLQAEEKDFFSGSILDSITQHLSAPQPLLNKSASFNHQKSKREELEEKRDGDGDEEKREVEDNGRKSGRCIPWMISAKQSKKPHQN